MKKTYESPSIEKVAFMYRDQVVVASNAGKCTYSYNGNEQGTTTCFQKWESPEGIN